MKIVKRIGLVLIAFLGITVLFGAVFVNCSPQFGGSISAAQLTSFAKTNHFKDGKFFNLDTFRMTVDCHSITTMLKKLMNPPDDLAPKKDIKANPIDPKRLTELKDQIIWLGHSSVIVRLDGKTVLLDPIFGQYAAPHSWLGRPRYSKKMAIEIKDIPSVDVIIISHDHYDHLDYDSIVALAPKTKQFLVPLGVGSHLKRWGVKSEKIAELDWWQERKIDGTTFVLTPSQHMSGRGLTGQSTTLWGSWVLKGKQHKLFYSGDGGYGKHFKQIGKKYGPFDFALMECGQYDKLWKYVHLSPEQTVRAGIEVGAKVMMPVHWGAFTLANHSWTEPAKRFIKEAKAKQRVYTTPEIGTSVYIGSNKYPTPTWWTKYD